MTDRRVIIEMGMGVDLMGEDQTKAAKRAVDDALRHSTLGILHDLDLPSEDMRVAVTIGVTDPDRVDAAQIAPMLPLGQVSVRVVKGGLSVTNPNSDQVSVIASAAVELFLPAQFGWRLKDP